MQDLFRYLIKENRLAEYLRASGWKQQIPQVQVPPRVSLDELEFDVPHSIIDARQHLQLNAA